MAWLMSGVLLFLATAAPMVRGRGNGTKSNILFILTDDQDITLGSLSVMPKLQKLVTDQGIHLFFASTTPRSLVVLLNINIFA